MKTKKLIPVVLFVLVSTFVLNAETVGIKNPTQHEGEKTKSFNVNKGGKLDININPGEIKISTWDKDEVFVKVKGLEEDELESVEMKLKGNTVYVTYDPQWGWGGDAEFSFTVPLQFNVDAKTSGGDIKIVSNISGDVDASSMGGDIKAMDINGKARLSTQGGDIKAGNITGSLTANTMGGDIKIGDIKGEFAKVNTMGGEIKIGKVSSELGATTYGGDIIIKGVGGNADLETMGGDIEVYDVSSKVKMDTKGGNLLVKNSSGSIQAVTYAGEIELYGITGSVDAKTMSGNIMAEINPSSGTKSSLFSQNGNIDLYMLGTVKTEVEAEIKTWGNWKYRNDDFKIESDFDSEKSNDNEDKKGIYKSYSINGGGSKINLKTANGSINIIKGKIKTTGEE